MSSANSFGTFLETYRLLKPDTGREVAGGSGAPRSGHESPAASVPSAPSLPQPLDIPDQPDRAAALLRAIADLNEPEPLFGKVAKRSGLNLTESLETAQRLKSFGLVELGQRGDGEKTIRLTESGRYYL